MRGLERLAGAPVPDFKGYADVYVGFHGNVLAIAENGVVSFLVLGHRFSLSRKTHPLNVIAAARIYTVLLEEGEDVLSLLEERLGKPGLFKELKEFLVSVASQLPSESRYFDFELAMWRLKIEAMRYRRVSIRMRDIAYTLLPLPVSSLPRRAEVVVRMKEPWRPPAPLAEIALLPEEVEEVTFFAKEDRIEIHGASLTLSRSTPAVEIVLAALLLKHLRERESVDALALLEEELGSPGLLTPLRKTLEQLLTLAEADPELLLLFSEK
ncbi:MAG: hypothetical protein QXJ59_04445 [Thermofilaceae archaeon]